MRTKSKDIAAKHISLNAITIVAGLFAGGMGTMLIARFSGLSGGTPAAVFNLTVLAPISVTCLVWLLLVHKKPRSKTAAWRKVLALSSVIGSILATLAFLVFVFFFTFDTEYAPGYSEEAFRAVEIGDSKEEVLSLLGQPLRVYGMDREVQSYSRSPSGSNYLMRDIVLDSEGRVVEIRSQVYWD
jgi:hypothetical protein